MSARTSPCGGVYMLCLHHHKPMQEWFDVTSGFGSSPRPPANPGGAARRLRGHSQTLVVPSWSLKSVHAALDEQPQVPS